MPQLPFLIEASLITGAGCILYKLLFESEKSFYLNRAYLLTILLLSFAVPFFSIPIFSEKLYVSTTITPQASDPIPGGFDWSILIIGFYSLIAMIYLIRLIIAYVEIFRMIKSTRSVSRDGIQYHISAEVSESASFFNHIFLRTADETEEVIEHELVHTRHMHSVDITLIQIAKVILWFNPFIYLFEKLLKQNHEYTADHIACKKLSGPTRFSEYLLKCVITKPKLSLTNTFNSFLKKRIVMLNKIDNPKRLKWKPFLMVPAIIGLFAFFSFDKYPTYYSAETGVLLDSIPLSHLDTIFTVDKTGKEVAQIVRVFPNELVETIDTVVIFDSSTYEEMVKIVKSQQPRTVIVNPELEDITYTEVIDTVITFDFDTYEETVRYVKRKIPKMKKKK